MSSWPYLGEGFSLPRDLPFFVVYPSGETLVFTNPANPVRLTASAIELNALIRTVDTAGLVGGGLQPFLAEDPPRTIDGGQGAFTARSGDVITARVVDQPASGGSAERQEYRRLLEQLQAIDAVSAAIATPFDDWAVTRRRFDPATDGESRRTTWTGPALADIVWERFDGIECAIINNLDWPYDNDERADARYVADGTLTTRRPLLPHEQNCADVIEFRAAVGV